MICNEIHILKALKIKSYYENVFEKTENVFVTSNFVVILNY